MSDTKELDELLEKLIDTVRGDPPHSGRPYTAEIIQANNAIRALFDAQAAELAAARERERWIPCAERLPVDSTAAHSVLVMASRWSFEKAKHLLWTAYYDELQSKWLDDVDHEPLIVSCWKDAPQPPAPEAQQ